MIVDIEKRFSPRVDVQLSAVISVSENLRLNVEVTNVSQNGVCVQCNTITRNLITPGGCFMRGLHPIELGVSLWVSEKENDKRQMGALCQVIYSRRIAKDQCQIGLKFKEMDAESRTLLQGIIDSVLLV